MVKKVYPKERGFSPFRDLLGYKFTKVENGRSQCVLEVTEKLLNPMGIVHGGAVFTIADAGMGIALWSSIGEDEIFVAAGTQIVYLKPVKSGTLICDSKIIQRGKRIAILESKVRNKRQLVAKATGIWSINKATKA